jgi:peptidoglycan/xylan/chitin deacetylase (PgdA/CDA1 family)
MLSWDEIQEMSDYGIDFGSHTCSHPYLTRMSKDELKTELLNSKSIIEARLNKPVRFFCHPYGNTNHQTQKAAEECGYLGAFGGLDFSLANSKDNLFNLKRVGTAHFSSLQDFKAGLLGTYDWYIKLKGMFVTPK